MAIPRFLQRLWPSPAYPALVLPDVPLCVIGDVHGRADLLHSLLDRIAAVPGPWRVMLLGDLIDRGPDSAAVLAQVRALCADPGSFVSFGSVMGNHERMMLDFLDDPARHGPRWLAQGGAATLESYGLSPHRRMGAETGAETGDRLRALRDGLRAALPEGTEAWLQALPLVWQEGGLVLAHAGADPARPIGEQGGAQAGNGQGGANHLWGHRHFLRHPRRDGLWVVHGHIITPHPQATEGRIAIDTGAWRTGHLTAALLSADGLRFLSTGEG